MGFRLLVESAFDVEGRGRENRERNHPDVVLRVKECTWNETRSFETRTTSASGESNAGWVVGSVLGGGVASLAVDTGGASGGDSIVLGVRRRTALANDYSGIFTV